MEVLRSVAGAGVGGGGGKVKEEGFRLAALAGGAGQPA